MTTGYNCTNMKTDLEYAKEEAINQFLRRRIASAESKPIQNANLVVGSPMFFYCKDCGILIERLPEDYLFSPYQRCSQCQGLNDENWLEDAKSFAKARHKV